MEWLNFHHLLYFWMVAREGSLAAASERLHLTQPTLSSQIKKLERTLGVSLFELRGRRLILTDTGRLVLGYAEQIFSLGQELVDVLQQGGDQRRIKLSVGIPDVLPKLVAFQLLGPALQLEKEVRLEITEGKLTDLLVDLAAYRLDVVLAESPLPAGTNIRAFNHKLGDSKLGCFGVEALASKLRAGFPTSLNGAPVLMPTQNTVLRRGIELWFDEHSIQPEIRHEFDDSALTKVFGQEGAGVFFAPLVIKDRICRHYDVQLVGEMNVTDSFYAISLERRLKHPAVLAICQAARSRLRGDAPSQSHQSDPQAQSDP